MNDSFCSLSLSHIMSCIIYHVLFFYITPMPEVLSKKENRPRPPPTPFIFHYPTNPKSPLISAKHPSSTPFFISSSLYFYLSLKRRRRDWISLYLWIDDDGGQLLAVRQQRAYLTHVRGERGGLHALRGSGHAGSDSEEREHEQPRAVRPSRAC